MLGSELRVLSVKYRSPIFTVLVLQPLKSINCYTLLNSEKSFLILIVLLDAQNIFQQLKQNEKKSYFWVIVPFSKCLMVDFRY